MTGDNEIFDMFAEIWIVLRKHQDFLNRKHHIDMDIDQEKKDKLYTENFTLTIHTESDDQSESLIYTDKL